MNKNTKNTGNSKKIFNGKVNPDEAVAYGASSPSCSTIYISDSVEQQIVTPISLDIQTVGDVMTKIIEI